MTPPNPRNKLWYNTLQTNKVVDRLTYCPNKHKQRKVRKMRQKLQQQSLVQKVTTPPSSVKTKFGSFNINGLDLETSWVLHETLEKRGFDVCEISKNNY